MKKSNTILFVIALVMIAGTALGMTYLRSNQRLGHPGIKAEAIPGSPRMSLFLPPDVLDYTSVDLPTDTNLLNGLPHDTSFVARHYTASDKTWIQLREVMMGTDRTSIHKPQFCLRGSGWDIDSAKSVPDTVRVERPYPYDLPVMKMVSSREIKQHDQIFTVRCLYVYWFVADNDLTSDHTTRMWKSTTHLLHTGELERWAYVSCFAVCAPGQEDATYDKLKRFIAASVPEFQLAAGRKAEAMTSAQLAPR